MGFPEAGVGPFYPAVSTPTEPSTAGLLAQQRLGSTEHVDEAHAPVSSTFLPTRSAELAPVSRLVALSSALSEGP